MVDSWDSNACLLGYNSEHLLLVCMKTPVPKREEKRSSLKTCTFMAVFYLPWRRVSVVGRWDILIARDGDWSDSKSSLMCRIFLPKEWLLEIKGTGRGHVWILKLREAKGPLGKSACVWFQDLSLSHKERTVGVRRLEGELGTLTF